MINIRFFYSVSSVIYFSSDAEKPNHQRAYTTVEEDKIATSSIKSVQSVYNDSRIEAESNGHYRCNEEVDLPIVKESDKVKDSE